MRFSKAFRHPDLVQELVRRLHRLAPPPATLMEVCGTHTMAIARYGLKALLPPQVRLISGPGCPVCVTAPEDLDAFLALGREPGVILATFGDMLRVPGSHTSLERERAAGVEVRVVYAPFDAVALARTHPAKTVIFLAVGFETTMPATAIALKMAAEQRLDNFLVYCLHKTLPPALKVLVTDDRLKVSGFLLPGHVSTIIGAEAYRFLAEDFHLPGAVAGFEPVDVLLGVEALLRQLKDGVARVDNVYTRVVPTRPNPRAQAVMTEVFAPADAAWRGLGVIPESGATLTEAYRRFDVKERFGDLLAPLSPPKPSPCRCGEVLRGILAPPECPQFNRPCNPAHPLGPCMVSSEGACAAAHKYELEPRVERL